MKLAKSILHLIALGVAAFALLVFTLIADLAINTDMCPQSEVIRTSPDDPALVCMVFNWVPAEEILLAPSDKR